jgi:hypothetical protein
VHARLGGRGRRCCIFAHEEGSCSYKAVLDGFFSDFLAKMRRRLRAWVLPMLLAGTSHPPPGGTTPPPPPFCCCVGVLLSHTTGLFLRTQHTHTHTHNHPSSFHRCALACGEKEVPIPHPNTTSTPL